VAASILGSMWTLAPTVSGHIRQFTVTNQGGQ
jgi:hypothetical protein